MWSSWHEIRACLNSLCIACGNPSTIEETASEGARKRKGGDDEGGVPLNGRVERIPRDALESEASSGLCCTPFQPKESRFARPKRPRPGCASREGRGARTVLLDPLPLLPASALLCCPPPPPPVARGRRVGASCNRGRTGRIEMANKQGAPRPRRPRATPAPQHARASIFLGQVRPPSSPRRARCLVLTEYVL